MHAIQFLRRGARYLTTGGAVNAAAYLAYLAMISVAVAPAVATAFVYPVCVGASYFINRRWTFQSRLRHRVAAPRYAAAYGIGYVFNVTAVSIIVRFTHDWFGGILAMGLTACLLFVLLHFAFREPRHVQPT